MSDKKWLKDFLIGVIVFLVLLLAIFSSCSLIDALMPANPPTYPSVEERAWAEQIWGFDIDE